MSPNDPNDPNDPSNNTGGGGAPPIDLFPKATLQKIADDGTPKQPPAPSNDPAKTARPDNVVRVPGWIGGHDLAIPGPFDFPAPPPPVSDDAREQYLGPAYTGLAFPPGQPGEFQDHITAEAALSLLPAALIGALAKPAVDYIYKLIDQIPETLRRPFEKAFGLLIDNGMSAAGAAISPLVDATVGKFYGDGKNLPTSANIPLKAYSQTEYSCGETAAAMILKWAGEPVSLNEVDTQLPFVSGTSGLVDEELRRRGLTLIAGPGDLTKLKAFLANGAPVMVSVGWEDGGGHLCVVSGYDDDKGTVTIVNYDAQGGTYQVKYADFAANWARHVNYMTAVLPQRDARLDELRQAGDLRRPTPIYEGLTLSDFYVNAQSQVFVEAAYRFVTDWTDITLRVNFDQSEDGLARQFGGTLAIQQKLATGWFLGLTVEKVSLRGKTDDWSSFSTAPISIYGSLKAPGFELRAGAERGGFQASLVADLGRFMAGLGLGVNVSVDDQGYRVYATLSGTF